MCAGVCCASCGDTFAEIKKKQLKSRLSFDFNKAKEKRKHFPDTIPLSSFVGYCVEKVYLYSSAAVAAPAGLIRPAIVKNTEGISIFLPRSAILKRNGYSGKKWRGGGEGMEGGE